MGEHDVKGRVVESDGNKEVEYPFEYFDAQVRFAIKWSWLSGEPLVQSLQTKTALYRRVTGCKYPNGEDVWQNLIEDLTETEDTDSLSALIYSRYLEQPHHVYTQPSYPENDGKHFGYFAFDHYPAQPETGEKDRIKVHFINKQRGDRSGLDAMYLMLRQADLKRMIEHIRRTYPDVEEVIGGSWLYALQSYKDSFPPGFTRDMKRLVPKGFDYIPNSVPNMSFEGNSVWGQFVGRSGGVRQHVYDQFLTNVEKAQSLDDLVDSFPNVPYQPKTHISVFYDWFGSRD